MTIAEAINAASAEYDEEVRRCQRDSALNELMASATLTEYQEIDQELPGYISEILGVLKMPPGVLDPRIYRMARMVFRMGMRAQRKLDQPDQRTATLWRSDTREQ